MTYSIVQMDPNKHRHDLLSLWRDKGSVSIERRFDWLYQGNPCGPAKTYLAQDNTTSEIVGCGTIYPRMLYIGGRRLVLGIAADFIVKQSHRILGPAVKIQRAICDGARQAGFDLLLAFPNDSAKAIFKRVGYTPLDASKNYVKLLRTGLKISQLIPNPIVSGMIALVANNILGVLDLCKMLYKPGTLTSEYVNVCDEHFDSLWERAKNDTGIVGARTSDYLNWRYLNCVGNEYKLLCLLNREKGEVVGYLSYFVRNGVAEIGDIFFDESNEILGYLLLELAKHLRRTKVNSISITFIGNHSFEQKLRQLNFFQRKTDRTCYLFLNEDSSAEYRNSILDPEKWLLFDGEIDL
ncbi:MAG: hypothetical protein AB2L21_00025 [Anaerolineaceae bacterium]